MHIFSGAEIITGYLWRLLVWFYTGISWFLISINRNYLFRSGFCCFAEKQDIKWTLVCVCARACACVRLYARVSVSLSVRVLAGGVWGMEGVWAELFLQHFRRFTYITTHSPTLPPLYLHHSSFSIPFVASSTSQFIPQLFFCFSYVTSSSLTSPGEPL